LTTGPDRLALVTGASSGIGRALCQDLVDHGWRVFGLSRRPGNIAHPHYGHLHADLTEVTALGGRLDAEVAGAVSDPTLRRMALVNNAADPGLLGPVDTLDPADLLKVYAVNTAAPVFLMGWFVHRCRPGLALRIVNVSTGAATDALPGLGPYGSSKAALRMAGKVLASELDERAAEGPAMDITILSYEPGIVDTEMQTAVRGSSRDIVPTVEMFRQFKAEGKLVPPQIPAGEIVDYVASDSHPRFMESRLGVPLETEPGP
jgi:benzil reductase ((S)-benzoin forming)